MFMLLIKARLSQAAVQAGIGPWVVRVNSVHIDRADSIFASKCRCFVEQVISYGSWRRCTEHRVPDILRGKICDIAQKNYERESYGKSVHSNPPTRMIDWRAPYSDCHKDYKSALRE